jgi:hypothetical protein
MIAGAVEIWLLGKRSVSQRPAAASPVLCLADRDHPLGEGVRLRGRFPAGWTHTPACRERLLQRYPLSVPFLRQFSASSA